MTANAHLTASSDDVELAIAARLSSINAVFSLSLILAQAPSPAQVMRLATSAVPSIAPGQMAVAWHPSAPGEYYDQAPAEARGILAKLTAPSRLDLDGSPSCWAFPLSSPLGREPVFLVATGEKDPAEEEIFLLSVLAQMCGAVVANRRMTDIHRQLTETVASGGEAGIAEDLHRLTGFPVRVLDGAGATRAAAGTHLFPERPLATRLPPGLLRQLRESRCALYDQDAWLMLASPREGVLGVIMLHDPGRTASATDVAALEYAATVLNVELGRLHSVAEAELRAQANRDRDVARARAAELAASEARQRAVLEAALDAVVSIDHRGHVTYVNSGFELTFGYRADEVTGRELADVIVPPSRREAHRQGLARHLATGESSVLDRRIELPAMRADGTEFPAEITITRTGPPGKPAFTGYIRDITERLRAERELMASRARLMAASDAVRQQVTRDLHDGAQQRLVTTLINLQLAEQKWESAPERARELVGLALGDARRGIEDLREIAAGIHPAVLTQRGLAAAIGSLAARLPVPVEVDVPGGRLPGPVEASVYFFCSEALTNVVKHARATCAWVRVELDEDQCAVEVRDDGIGGATPRSESSGLTGLRDRIGALNGAMEITSPASGGTVLRATVPLSR